MATLDPATALYHGEHFKQRLTYEIEQALEEGRPYSVIACVPQRLPGEDMTDVVRAAAACVREVLRGEDSAGRLADDTIVLGLADTQASGARSLAYRLKGDLALLTGRMRRVVWDAGFASLGEDGVTAEELIAAAIADAKQSRRHLAQRNTPTLTPPPPTLSG